MPPPRIQSQVLWVRFLPGPAVLLGIVVLRLDFTEEHLQSLALERFGIAVTAQIKGLDMGG